MPLALCPPGWSMGVDISDHQGRVDALAFQAAGIQFAWIKLTDGEQGTQRHAVDNAIALSEGASIPIGFYHVLRPHGVAAVERQVAHFCRTLSRLTFAPRLPAWLDFEVAGAGGGGGLSELATAAAWCELHEAASGRTPMVYTGPAFMARLARGAGAGAAPVLARLQRFPLAVAHYGRALDRGPDVPAPWEAWTIWQASGDPPAPGQRPRAWARLPGGGGGAVDLNYYRGPVADLITMGETL